MSEAAFEGLRGDLPLLEGENPDLRQEASEMLGDAWFTSPNSVFGWNTPEQLEQRGFAYLVRNNLRQISFIGSA